MRAALKPLMSSASVEWETPQDLFNKLNAEFGPLELDVAASAQNAKCGDFFTKEDNGLLNHWMVLRGFKWVYAKCWMNPPYGRTIGQWVKKAYDEAQMGCTVVCLLPARTDTRWFHEYCTKGEIRFIRGRLKFGGHKNAAPFPSMVVIFKPND